MGRNRRQVGVVDESNFGELEKALFQTTKGNQKNVSCSALLFVDFNEKSGEAPLKGDPAKEKNEVCVVEKKDARPHYGPVP